MRQDPGGWTTRYGDADIRRYRAAGVWRDVTLWTMALAMEQRSANRIAVVDGDQQTSFGALMSESRALAGALQTFGLVAGDVISFQLPNWRETLVINLAAARLGLVCNPIVSIYRDAEVGHILRDAGSKLMFVPSAFRSMDYLAMMERLRSDLPDLKQVLVVRGQHAGLLSYDEVIAGAMPWTGDDSLTDPNNVKLVMYTSGTTGAAKGVLHSHNTIMAEIDAVRGFWGITDRDVVLMPSPVTHITGYLYALEIAFAAGVKVVFMEKWNAAEALDLIKQHGVTFSVGATPFLMELAAQCQARGSDLSPMRLFMSGGAPVPPEVIHRANELLPDGMAFRVYGSTEAPTITLGIQSRADLARGATTDGRVVNHEVRLCDAASGALVTQGEGEICTRGPEMMLGYTDWRQTVEAFDPAGFFHTGDLGYFVEGDYLCVSGRKKDLIIRGGENISPKEIEDVLHTHPGIAEAAVVAMPHERLGEGVCAYLVLRQTDPLSVAEVSAFLERAGLARQKFPERVEIVADLPRTASGKVQKNVLREGQRVALQGK